MKLDSFSNPIFTDSDLFDFLYQGKDLDPTKIIVDNSKEISLFEQVSGSSFRLIPTDQVSLSEFDKTNQTNWFMPVEYYSFDIKKYCLEKCSNDIEYQRVIEEYNAFEDRGMIKLLQWLKYFVDTCYQHNILWGVGRGSSVSSYVLYLLEVHDINSIKYNLDWHDFLR